VCVCVCVCVCTPHRLPLICGLFFPVESKGVQAEKDASINRTGGIRIDVGRSKYRCAARRRVHVEIRPRERKEKEGRTKTYFSSFFPWDGGGGEEIVAEPSNCEPAAESLPSECCRRLLPHCKRSTPYPGNGGISLSLSSVAADIFISYIFINCKIFFLN